MTDIGYSVTPRLNVGGQHCYNHRSPSCNLLIHFHNFLVILINGIEADVLTVRTVLRTQLLIPPELLYLSLQIFAITASKQLAGLANLNQLRDATNVRTQHRRAVHLRFITENGQFSYHSDG